MMDSDDDFSDYEDKAMAPEYHLFSMQDDLQEVGLHHTQTSLHKIILDGNNDFSVVEKASEDLRKHSKEVNDLHCEDPNRDVQDICELLETDTKSTRSSLSDRTNVSSPCTLIPLRDKANSSSYSRLLGLMQRESDLPKVNNVQGENSGYIPCVLENKKDNVSDEREFDRGLEPAQALFSEEVLSTFTFQENWSLTSDCEGAYISDTFSTDYGYPRLKSHDVEAANTSTELLTFPKVSDTLVEETAENKFSCKKIFPVHNLYSSNAEQETYNLEKDTLFKKYLDERERSLNSGIMVCSDRDLRSSTIDKKSSFQKLQEQLNIFHLRIKVQSGHTPAAAAAAAVSIEKNKYASRLEIHFSHMKSLTCFEDLDKNLSEFSIALKNDKYLANCFLSSLVNYAHSVLDLNTDLTKINEFLECIIPHVRDVITSQIDRMSISIIRDNNFVQNLYKTMVNVFIKETRYREESISKLLQYQQKDKNIKAHIARMTPQDSQKLFQETFSDKGNPSDLYLIYIWQILQIYEIGEENALEIPVLSITDLLEDSGKFISVLPTKDMKKEGKVPFTYVAQKSVTESSDKLKETPKPFVDISFEWVNFHIGQLYENGVVFLINMMDWVDHLQKISLSIEQLEVKKNAKFVPSLGSTYALLLQVRIIDRLYCTGAEQLALLDLR
nr:uncharacterized protein LOC128705387 [Cherax quadricarinatus]